MTHPLTSRINLVWLKSNPIESLMQVNNGHPSSLRWAIMMFCICYCEWKRIVNCSGFQRYENICSMHKSNSRLAILRETLGSFFLAFFRVSSVTHWMPQCLNESIANAKSNFSSKLFEFILILLTRQTWIAWTHEYSQSYVFSSISLLRIMQSLNCCIINPMKTSPNSFM